MLLSENTQTTYEFKAGWLIAALVPLLYLLVLFQVPDAQAATQKSYSAEAAISGDAVDLSHSRSNSSIGNQQSKSPLHLRSSFGDPVPDMMAVNGWSHHNYRQIQSDWNSEHSEPSLSARPLNPRAPPAM